MFLISNTSRWSKNIWTPKISQFTLQLDIMVFIHVNNTLKHLLVVKFVLYRWKKVDKVNIFITEIFRFTCVSGRLYQKYGSISTVDCVRFECIIKFFLYSTAEFIYGQHIADIQSCRRSMLQPLQTFIVADIRCCNQTFSVVTISVPRSKHFLLQWYS